MNGKPFIVKNIKYGHKDHDKSQDLNDVKKEEVDDIKDEELEEEGSMPYLSKKEKRRQRLLGLCFEECGEKKAQSATDHHLRKAHGGERPFLCAECPKKFKKRDQLEIHEKRKHKPRSHICDICGKHFDNAHYITQHKRTVPFDLEKLACDICGKLVLGKIRLKVHKQRNHSDNGYQQCSLCGVKIRTGNYKVNSN